MDVLSNLFLQLFQANSCYLMAVSFQSTNPYDVNKPNIVHFDAGFLFFTDFHMYKLCQKTYDSEMVYMAESNYPD